MDPTQIEWVIMANAAAAAGIGVGAAWALHILDKDDKDNKGGKDDKGK